MKLPEPARTLWTRHREAIERIATTPGAESQIMLGGGTLLAARWKHRESTDIDVLLPGRDNLNDARENGPLDLAAATGGEHKESSRDRLRVELQAGMLDVAAIQPQMPGLEEQLDVEGRKRNRAGKRPDPAREVLPHRQEHHPRRVRLRRRRRQGSARPRAGSQQPWT